MQLQRYELFNQVLQRFKIYYQKTFLLIVPHILSHHHALYLLINIGRSLVLGVLRKDTIGWLLKIINMA